MNASKKRYSDKALQNFKLIIETKRHEAMKEAQTLKSRLDALEEQASLDGGHSYGEDSKNHEQREMLTRVYERQIKNIHELELALGRIANKTYGICKKTGDLIAEARLLAMPTATTRAQVSQ